jgi:transcriptional regulator with XRE-family HTH domain
MTPAQVFARAVRSAREQCGTTQDELAERLTELGLPFDRSMVAKVEGERRGVSLDEVLGFAVALGVSPVSLLVPQSAAETVALTPNTPVESVQASLWARGYRPLTDPGDDVDGSDYAFYRTALAPYYIAEADRRLPGVPLLETLVAELVAWAGHALDLPPSQRERKAARWDVVLLQLEGVALQLKSVMKQARLAELKEG